MLRGSAARSSITRLQQEIDRTRNSFDRAYRQMNTENASVENDFDDVVVEIRRVLGAMSEHLRSQSFHE